MKYRVLVEVLVDSPRLRSPTSFLIAPVTTERSNVTYGEIALPPTDWNHGK